MKPTKPKRDTNQLAKLIVDIATGDADPSELPVATEKNPAAVALGRLGGLKGGKARADKLSKDERPGNRRGLPDPRYSRTT